MSILTLDRVAVSHGSHPVVQDIRLQVARGEVCALMAPSGAGKTTILRVVAALQPFQAGQVRVDDVVLLPGPVPPQSRLARLRSLVGMVFQGSALFDHLTVLENVMLAPVHALGWTPHRARERAGDLLAALGVAGRADAYPYQLSGGEAQRVAVARALALDPPVLLLDEPTAALDPARRGALAEMIRTLAAGGRALLVATHDVELARTCADRVVVLSDGRVVEEGLARSVLDAPAHVATRALLAIAGPGSAQAESPEPRIAIHGREH